MEAQLIEDPIEQKLGKRGSRKIDEWCKNWCGKMRGIFLSKVSYVMLLRRTQGTGVSGADDACHFFPMI